jgi:hypothetical protein
MVTASAAKGDPGLVWQVRARACAVAARTKRMRGNMDELEVGFKFDLMRRKQYMARHFILAWE